VTRGDPKISVNKHRLVTFVTLTHPPNRHAVANRLLSHYSIMLHLMPPLNINLHADREHSRYDKILMYNLDSHSGSLSDRNSA
jgi:hypothetical protein